ncbi:MAG: hypothetical protein NC213_09100 [Acetobacter sp.]|nr:hypothetical protein [Bacteroides sp.]MCM1341886.1 hypothetical protein [Acetobacter sp.]MCM1433183.1 hypothetical protein [Clostridiales bacterium]
MSDDFKAEMNRFGDYVLIFDVNELLDNISEVTSENNIGCIADYVVYKEIYSDFVPVKFSTEDEYNRFFVKDAKYKKQNEYRIIVDGKDDFLKSNREKGYLLKTKPLKSAMLIDTNTFFETAKIEMRE